MKKKKEKEAVPKINSAKGTFADESNTFGASTGIPSPRRKSFGVPGPATKDKRHGVNQKKSLNRGMPRV